MSDLLPEIMINEDKKVKATDEHLFLLHTSLKTCSMSVLVVSDDCTKILECTN